jgi:hypothetical protein
MGHSWCGGGDDGCIEGCYEEGELRMLASVSLVVVEWAYKKRGQDCEHAEITSWCAIVFD